MNTYPATLRDGRIEWGKNGAPPVQAGGSLDIEVSVVRAAEPADDTKRSAELLAILEEIAARGGVTCFGDDPVAWQREQRIDRPLYGRDE